jgi:hypothetical protein
MAKRKRRSRRKRLYLQALIALIAYYVVGNAILVKSLGADSLVMLFLPPALYGAITAVIFLYLFSHEDMFKFARALEKREEKTSKKWLKFFSHTGKIIATFAVATVAGPIVAALVIRFLLTTARYRYLLAIFTTVPSTLFTVGVAKGVIHLVFLG